MPYPTKPTLGYSYTAFAQGQGDNAFPGTSLDTDLAVMKQSLDATIDFIEDVVTSDGKLRVLALPADQALVEAEVAGYAADAAASAAAAAASAASINGTVYLAKADNLSGLANVATARGNLGLGALALLGSVGTSQIDNDAVITAKIPNLAVTTGKIADLGVTTGKIADGAVSAAKLANGAVVQCVGTQVGTLATGTTLIPADNTVPQITEGDQFLTQSITPLSATNILIIDVVLMLSSSATQYMCGAIFQGSTANAIACGMAYLGVNVPVPVRIRHRMVAGTTSPISFSVRAGGNNAGTTTLNGVAGVQYYGGTFFSSIQIMEVKA